MTIEKFYETLRFVQDIDRELKLQSGLETINQNLSNLVSAPAQPQHQSGLATALATFADSVRNLNEALSPPISEAIAELGGEDYFDSAMADKVQASITANAMTPSVALTFVQKLSTQRAAFMATVSKTLSGLSELGVTSTPLEAGSADFAFVIPRELFDDELGSFAKELGFISRMIQNYSEALMGTAQPARLETLSSSVPTVALLAALPVISAFAGVVNKFLEAWEKVEKIRKIRADLTDVGMEGDALNQLTERITTTVSEVVEESTQLVLANFKGDTGRRNELEIAISQDTSRLFGQIERGLVIQFRAEPNETASAADQKALNTVENLSRTLQFPQVKSEPMLLASGEILEGAIEIKKTFKKTTTTIKSTEKKAAGKTIKATV
jgi:hypothetical protein